MYGYPTEIPMSRAISIFNEETRCKTPYKDYPPLTEDELIAAIVAGPDWEAGGGLAGATRRTMEDRLAESDAQGGAAGRRERRSCFKSLLSDLRERLRPEV